MSEEPRSPFEAAPGQKLLGEIVSWNFSAVHVDYEKVASALSDTGLEGTVLRERRIRDAFARAVHTMKESRIIRLVYEDTELIRFQFTKEEKAEADERFEYRYETVLTLDKKTGDIACLIPELRDKASRELKSALAVWTASDLTAVVQRLFDRQADLFPIREQGGAYFVPQMHRERIDRITDFARRIGGRMRRFPIAAGTTEGARSVREAVTDGLEDVIQAHKEAVTSFNLETRGAILERQAERIRQTKFKIQVYAEYLSSSREHLEAELEKASMLLREKVERLSTDCVSAGT
jgi:hypothetical protein